jgi:16S rRNA processing protein RimM
VHGEITVEVHTDFPERLTVGSVVGLGVTAPERSIAIRRLRWHKGRWLLFLEGIEDRDGAEALRGSWIFLPAQDRSQLPENYYYEHEIVGLTCVDAGARRLGEVLGFAEFGGGSLLRVMGERGEVLVPFHSPIVVRVDLAKGVVVVDPPRGLFDDDAL